MSSTPAGLQFDVPHTELTFKISWTKNMSDFGKGSTPGLDIEIATNHTETSSEMSLMFTMLVLWDNLFEQICDFQIRGVTINYSTLDTGRQR